MKNTLARLKAIFSANLNFFMFSALVSGAIYVALYVLIINTHYSVENVNFTKIWALIFTLLVGIIPIFAYVSFHASNLSSGIKSAEINTKTAKRNLFLASGLLWASIICFVVCVIANNVSSLLFISAIAIILTWHFISKTLTKYVFTL